MNSGCINWARSVSTFRAIFLLLSACAIPRHAQVTSATAAAPVADIRVDVRLAVLQVTVRERKGGKVPKLERRDFVVEEDGRPASDPDLSTRGYSSLCRPRC
jgi:hypothetical protein